MSDCTKTADPKTGDLQMEATDEAALTRRQSLKAVAKYAAFVAPAMTVLVQGSAEAAPNCDNPGLHLGVKRSGHSGC